MITFNQFKEYLDKNFLNPEVLAERKKWHFPEEVNLETVRAYLSENKNDPAVTQFRLSLLKAKERDFEKM